MITPSFALTATERVLPRLALDFTTGSLDPRVTFTRASTATFYNASGVLSTAAINAPRFDYNPVTLAPMGLLIEEQRTNLVLRSEQFENASWVSLVTTVTANATTAPDGTLTGDILVPNMVSTGHATYQDIIVSSGVAYAHTVYAKAAGYSWLAMRPSSGTAPFAYFNLTAGTIGTVGAGLTASITPVGNGWYRCTVIFTMGSATNRFHLYPAQQNGDIVFAGDGTSGIYVWGAQLEAGAFATSYIPTTTTALTRNADVASMTGTNFSSWYNQTQGTLLSDVMLTQVGTTFAYTVSDNTVNNQIYHRELVSGGDCAVVTSNFTQAYLTKAYTPAVGSIYQAAIGYAANNIGFTVNAASVVTDTSATIPTLDRLYLGASFNGAAQRSIYLRSFYYWPQRLTNAELQAFTS